MLNPRNVLTFRQTLLLKRFSQEVLFRDFYLTGGTALAAFHLGRQFETLFECTYTFPEGDRVEMDFALDMPGRLSSTRRLKAWVCG